MCTSDSLLYLDISRSFKCPKSSPVVCLICYFLAVFVLREYILKVHILVSSEHILCVGSFNMDWRILVFYPEPEARDKIY